MTEEKELFLNIRLVGSEVDNFEQALSKVGVRTNAELVRFLVKYYISREGCNE
jgi:hypothetical protein